MFCKQCGKPIDAGLRQCPYCGRIPDALSGGTGFWNLTQLPPSQQPVPQPVQQPIQAAATARPAVPIPPVQEAPLTPPPMPEVSENTREAGSGGGRLLLLIFGVIVLILLVSVIVLGTRVSKLNSQLDTARAELQAAEEALQAIELTADTEKAPEPVAEDIPEPPAASPAVTPPPAPSEEPTPEPSEEPTPAPVEEPEEAPEAAAVSTEPAAVSARLSMDWSSITLTVEDEGLDVESYQWIVVYDSTLETTGDCLEIMDRAIMEEDPLLRNEFVSQVDPYDGSSGRAQQRIPVSEFYQTSGNYTKRIFCKMTLTSGEVTCSEMISPVLVASDGYVTLQQTEDSVTATVEKLPDYMTGGEISCYWLEVDPKTETELALDAEPYAEGLTASITTREDMHYYFVMEKNGIRIAVTEPLASESPNSAL